MLYINNIVTRNLFNINSKISSATCVQFSLRHRKKCQAEAKLKRYNHNRAWLFPFEELLHSEQTYIQIAAYAVVG